MRKIRWGGALQTGMTVLPIVKGCRGYFWPYSEDMVPADAKPSSFQASPVPSVRENIIREYALGPLFGARTPLCVLGFFPPPPREGVHDATHAGPSGAGRARAAALLDRKAALRVALAELLSCEKGDVQLGHIAAAKDMMMFRPGTPESPKLGDGAGSSGQWQHRRLSRYARKPIAATVFMDVYVPDSMFETAEEKRSFARFVQDRLTHHAAEADGFDATKAAFEANASATSEAAEPPSAPTSSDTPAQVTHKRGKLNAQQREAFETDMEERARVLDSVADLLELGVVCCEVPVKEEDVDGHDYRFDRLHGKEMDLETAESVLDRWDARLRL